MSLAWSKLVSDTVLKVAREDQRIVAITPAMPVVQNLKHLQTEFPDRMFDVGIAEQHATTMAAGLATQNMKPFLSDLFDVFTTCIRSSGS